MIPIPSSAISGYASTLDGPTRDLFADPVYWTIAQCDLEQGQHRNGNGNVGLEPEIPADELPRVVRPDR